MKRTTLDIMFSVGGLIVAGLLLVMGVVLTGNADFAEDYTGDQLAAQQISFKAADKLTAEEKQAACLVEYAGQKLTTGKQAECYANDFIGEHVKDVAGGKTYAELGGPERALQAKVAAAQKANDPALADLQKQHAAIKGQRDALFQGETSRGLLLTSFGFDVLGAKAEQAATVAYLVAGLLGLLSLVSLVVRRRSPKAATVSEHRPVKAILGDKQLVDA